MPRTVATAHWRRRGRPIHRLAGNCLTKGRGWFFVSPSRPWRPCAFRPPARRPRSPVSSGRP